ncbi:hypothetical protein D9M68_964800 [compost metagenome]
MQQAKHATLALIQLLLQLLLLAVLSNFGQIEIALQGMHLQRATGLVLDLGGKIFRHILFGTPQSLRLEQSA